MKEEYDLSAGKRGAVIPSDNIQVTIWIDPGVFQWFTEQSEMQGRGLQSLINDTLKAHIKQQIEVSAHSRTARPLAAMLVKCDPDAPTPEEAREWESTPPIGNEII